jgi:hypothetical protein
MRAFISIQAGAMDGVFFRGFDNQVVRKTSIEEN